MTVSLVFFVSFFLIMPFSLHGVVVNYYKFVDNKTGHEIHLFGDWHVDTSDLTHTYKHMDEIYKFVRSCPKDARKELIVEDVPSMASRMASDTSLLNSVADQDLALPYAQTKTNVVATMSHSELAYALRAIPVYNVELRFSTRQHSLLCPDTARALLQPDDSFWVRREKAILKECVDRLPGTLDEQLKAIADDPLGLESKFVDIHIRHRLYYNKQENVPYQFVVAGAAHIQRVAQRLRFSGYTQQQYVTRPLHDENEAFPELLSYKLLEDRIKPAVGRLLGMDPNDGACKEQYAIIDDAYELHIAQSIIDIAKLPRPQSLSLWQKVKNRLLYYRKSPKKLPVIPMPFENIQLTVQ